MKITTSFPVLSFLIIALVGSASQELLAAQQSAVPSASQQNVQVAPPPITVSDKEVLAPSEAAKTAFTVRGYLREDATSIFFKPHPLIKGPGDVKQFQIPLGTAPSRGKFFWWYGKDLHLSSRDLVKESIVVPEFMDTGLTFSRHVQYYRPSGAIKIEVRGAGCALLEKDSTVTSGNCRLVTGLDLDVTNPLSKADAISAAIAAVSSKGLTVDSAKTPPAQLMIVPKGDASNPKNYRLAWSVNVLTIDPFDMLMVDVLAKSGPNENAGEILDTQSQLRESAYVNHDDATGLISYPYDIIADALYGLTDNASFYTRPKEDGGKYHLESGALCSADTPDKCIIPQGVTISTYDATQKTSFNANDPAAFIPYSNDSTIWIDSHAKLGVSVFWGLQKTIEYFHSRYPAAFAGGKFELFLTPSIQNSVYTPLTDQDPETEEIQLLSHILAFRSKPMMEGFCGPAVSIDSVAHEYVHRIFQQINKGMWPDGESGAIEEGFADIFALLTRFSVEGESPEWLFREKECSPDYGYKLCFIRSLSNPKGKPGCEVHNPDTHDGKFYRDPSTCAPSDPTCAHVNSTIVSHWYYLLNKGGSGTNDLNVSFTVKPIDAAMAQDIAYVSMWFLHPKDTFADLRENTIQTALAVSVARNKPLEGPTSLRASVENAWYAVGVGSAYDARTYSPVYGAPNVDPWPAKLTWSVFPGEVEWYVGVFTATDTGFQLHEGVRVDPSSCAAGQGCSATFKLDADTVYYWRVIGKNNQPVSPGEPNTDKQFSAGQQQGEIQELDTTKLQGAQNAQIGELRTSKAAPATTASKPSLFKRILSSITSLFSRTPEVEGSKQTPFSLKTNVPGQAPGVESGELMPGGEIPTIPPDVVSGNAGWGNWGHFRPFTTSANKPKPVPAGNKVNPWHDELKFKGVASATAYIVEISEGENFAKVLKSIDVDPANPESKSGEFLKATISGLEPEINYLWSVTAGRLDPDEGGGVSWGEPSDPDQFLTIRPSTKLISPLNAQEVNPLGIDLKWEKVPGATSYAIAVGDKVGPGPFGKPLVTPTVIEVDQSGTDNTTYAVTIDPAKYVGKSEFSWQVTPMGPSTVPDGTPSEIGTFKINIALSAVTALYPYRVDSIKQDVEYNGTIDYFWTHSPGATKYIVNVLPKSSGAPIMFEVPQQNPITWGNRNDVIRITGPDSTRAIDPGGYSWSVSAAKDSLVGAPSNQLSYQTGNGPITLGSPPAGATIGTQNQVLQWNAASAPWGVYLEYWTYPGQPTIHTYGPLGDDNVADGSSLTGSVIPEGSWFWRICSFEGNNSPSDCGDGRTLIVKASAPETPKDPGNTSNNPSGCTQAPAKPTLTYPVEGNVTYVPLTFTAQWSASPGATDYHYALMKVNDTVDYWIADVNAVTPYLTQQFTLPTNSWGYYSPYGFLLYVAARNACGESPPAQAWVHQ